MQKENKKNNCHSRVSLSGISTLDKKQGLDPRQKPSGMTANLNLPLMGKSSSPLRERAEFVSTGVRGYHRGFTFLRHPEFISGSSRYNNQMLKQVQQDGIRGFTLIELLVVVLIIGILAAIALPQYQKAVEKSRATEIAIFLQEAHKAVALYQLAHGLDEKVFYDYHTSPVTNALDELDIDLSGQVASLSKNFGVYIGGDADGSYVNLIGIFGGPRWANEINSTVSPTGAWSGDCAENICDYLQQQWPNFVKHY